MRILKFLLFNVLIVAVALVFATDFIPSAHVLRAGTQVWLASALVFLSSFTVGRWVWRCVTPIFAYLEKKGPEPESFRRARESVRDGG